MLLSKPYLPLPGNADPCMIRVFSSSRVSRVDRTYLFKKRSAALNASSRVWFSACGLSPTGSESVSGLTRTTAIQEWAVARGKSVTYVHKGQHPLTEHYRCVEFPLVVAVPQLSALIPHPLVLSKPLDNVFFVFDAETDVFSFLSAG